MDLLSQADFLSNEQYYPIADTSQSLNSHAPIPLIIHMDMQDKQDLRCYTAIVFSRRYP
jgi:hypothetical protein